MEQLKNPQSESYLVLKSLILGNTFPFYYKPTSNKWEEPVEGHEGTPFWSHTVLQRPLPEWPVPQVGSEHLPRFCSLFIDIMRTNEREYYSLLRVNVNATYPTLSGLPTVPHRDHNCPHKNLLVYLTSAGGKTVATEEGEEHEPQEDDIVLFEGIHYNHPPKQDRRVVIVYTYF